VAPDSIRIRLHLRLIRAVRVLVDSIDELVVEVTSTRSWSRCPDCGAKCRRVHDIRSKKIRDLPVSGRRMTLVWLRRRFSCDVCGERHLESHPEIEGKITRRLARQLVADARVMPIRAVARRHGLSWHLIMALVTAWSTKVQTHRRARRCRVLLIDETSIRRRHNYVTVLMNGDTGEVLAMVPHRDAAAVCGFLAQQTHSWRRSVKVVATDGSRAYKTAIDTMLPHARHVLDRFHVVRVRHEALCVRGRVRGPPR
jgi:transposase